MRVLLVEDDVMIGRSLDRALTDAGMAVDWVRSSADCSVAVRGDGYGVLLLDLGRLDQERQRLIIPTKQSEDVRDVIEGFSNRDREPKVFVNRSGPL